MSDRLRHRGPDDAGVWCDSEAGVALGHRRLSVIDLSDAGHQPMVSANGRYVLILNGEIYNFRELRAELERSDYPFRGNSDTECALAAFQQWSFENALKRFVGMFALALWDRRVRMLFLARDRIGEKPVYYGTIGHNFVFASELNAIRAHPSWSGSIDPNALGLFTKYGYIPAPQSIFTGINKLLPGTYLSLTDEPKPSIPRLTSYWSAADVVLDAIRDRQDPGPDDCVEDLDRLLRTTVKDKMIADVPLGAFLSGGIDSSAVVSIMQQLSPRPVRTFSIGFCEKAYDEAAYAKAVASHLGSDHTELYVTADDALAVIPQLPEIYDEPFADSSQIPTYLISKLARQHVTVALSGDGGDELFGGYTRYSVGRDLWRSAIRIPSVVRGSGSAMIRRCSPSLIDKIFVVAKYLLPKRLRFEQMGNKLHKLATVWAMDSPDAIYQILISSWNDPREIVAGIPEQDLLAPYQGSLNAVDNVAERWMLADLVTYLPGDILTKVDRASMSVSLEVRVPFLDHRVVEFAWRQPFTAKLRGQQSKCMLRQVLSRYVPADLVDRPKMGFGVPIDAWLRGPLKDWAEALLDEQRLRREGHFEPEPIRRKWTEHSNGKVSWHSDLWPILMFQSWQECYARGN
jgi:asparagine synthase (glutamine-hydrolysing)